MKIKKRIAIPSIGILTIFLMSLFFNISNFSMRENSIQYSTSDMGMAVESSPEMEFTDEAKLDADFDTNGLEPSKVITSIYISLETLEFNATTDRLGQIINKHNGYIANSNISQNNYINSKILKHAQYTIRVPKEKIDNFVNEIDALGNVISQNTSKQDITKQYHDTESRLNVLKIKEERILALLEKADKIEDIITLENQLSDIIYQKESLTKNILDMDDKISYSTVSINISEVEKLTNGVTAETSFGAKIMNAMNDSIYFFKISLQKLVITLIYILPYLIIVGIISALVYKYIRKKHE